MANEAFQDENNTQLEFSRRRIANIFYWAIAFVGILPAIQTISVFISSLIKDELALEAVEQTNSSVELFFSTPSILELPWSITVFAIFFALGVIICIYLGNISRVIALLPLLWLTVTSLFASDYTSTRNILENLSDNNFGMSIIKSGYIRKESENAEGGLDLGVSGDEGFCFIQKIQIADNRYRATTSSVGVALVNNKWMGFTTHPRSLESAAYACISYPKF